jgi:Domain of unknown function (DUF4118)
MMKSRLSAARPRRSRKFAEMTSDSAGSRDSAPSLLQPQARKPESRKRLAATVLNLSVVAGLTVAVTLASGSVPSTAILVCYFAPVLLAVLVWNFEQGVIAAFAGALAAEFFLFAPRLSFSLADRRDMTALLIYLCAALLSGYLVDEVGRLRRAPSGAAPVRPVLKFGGPTRTVPERVAEFLVGRENAMYCDQCIQDQLGLKWRQQVQLVTATLAVTRLFQRDSGQCRTCNQFKQVIRHVETR